LATSPSISNPTILSFIQIPRIHETIFDLTGTTASYISIGRTISHDYRNGGVVFMSVISGAQASITGTLNLLNLPTATAGQILACTTTLIINQNNGSATNIKAWMRNLSINGTAQAMEYIGSTMPSISASTSTVIQTITVLRNNTTTLRAFTNVVATSTL
jgi:hypothetical protein